MKRLQGSITGISPKTARVQVSTRWRHPVYKKSVVRSKTYLCQLEIDNVVVGDRVEIEQCRPISKRKHFVVVSKLAS